MLYFLLSSSFSIMFSINYCSEVWLALKTTCNIFDINIKEKLNIYVFYITNLIVVTILFPLVVIAVFTYEKYELIEIYSKIIMQKL